MSPSFPTPRRRARSNATAAFAAALLAGGAVSLAGPATASTPDGFDRSLGGFRDLRSAIDAGQSEFRALPTGVLMLRDVPRGSALRTAPGAPPAPEGHLTASPVSRFTVNFIDDSTRWTSASKAAFQSAADLWGRSIESKVPIVVTATATRFASSFQLGSAGPANFYRDTKGTSTLADDVFDPLALANAKNGRDVSPDEPDIEARFNPDYPGLYFGTDGKPPSNSVDFRSIVLHELGHGLGLIGSAAVLSDGRATVGDDGVNRGVVRSGLAYDQFTYATTAQQAGNGGSRILSLPDGSAALKNALTGGQLYWSGQLARTAVGGGKVRMFAPSPWQQGSSYGHVDEDTYPSGSGQGLMTPSIGDGEAFTSVSDVSQGMLADMGYSVASLVGSRFTPLDPVRLLDTRSGTGAPKAVVGAGGVLDLKVTGAHGVPDNATAVVLNVTGVSPSAVTDVRVYPTPVVLSAVPQVSNLNLAKGTTRANLVTVPVGNNGRVRLRNSTGTVSLLADLSGFYAPGAAASFTALDPTRLLDTRSAQGISTKTRIPAAGQVDLKVAAVGGVPADATAVALTVTAVNATKSTDIRVYPATSDTATVPIISNLNLGSGPGVPNVVIVKLGEGGVVRLRNQSGEVHLLADVAGYYSPGNGSLYRSVSPARLLDTRTRLGTSPTAPTRLGAAGTLDLAVSGAALVPSTAQAVVLNVTGVTSSGSTDIRVYPATATAVPTVSNLNLAKNQTAADLVIVKLGNGKVRLRNNAGTVALLADVSGWFGPA